MIREAIKEAVGPDEGDIIQVRDFALDDPAMKIWNGAKGQIVSAKNGNFKVRITDIKGSNVQYSVKWSQKLDKATKQTLTLKLGEFIILRDV